MTEQEPEPSQDSSFIRHLARTILTSYQFWMITSALLFGYMLGRAAG